VSWGSGEPRTDPGKTRKVLRIFDSEYGGGEDPVTKTALLCHKCGFVQNNFLSVVMCINCWVRSEYMGVKVDLYGDNRVIVKLC
jgi:hypothetical protein